MESLQQEQPTTQNQAKIQENQQKPTSLNEEKSGIQVSKIEDHDHLHLQQQKQSQQQQQLKRPNESKNEEKMQTLNTQECKNEEEDKKSDENSEKVSENGGNMGPRERLKRHRREVAGQVWIPEMWGQEDFLKDWIDCSAFDASLMPQGLMLARASLMQQGTTSNSNSLRLENTSC